MSLYDPISDKSVEEIFKIRERQLGKFKGTDYSAIIVELFPFGRKKFRTEILPWIERMKEENPEIIVCCSLRDILVEKEDQAYRDAKIAKWVNRHFDYVFVHSDERVVRLEESFLETPAIVDCIQYTGYVTESGWERGLESQSKPKSREKRILISQGGGIVGGEILLGMSSLCRHFPDYQFQFVLGPNAPIALREELEILLRDQENATCADFLDDFPKALSSSALSVSLAGYNTVMNLLETQTPSLVYPYDANREQGMRANRLEKLGCLGVLNRVDLAPDRLRKRIDAALAWSPQVDQVDLRGAENTASILETLLPEPGSIISSTTRSDPILEHTRA